MGACWGKILWIDLDTSTSQVEEISSHVYRQYLGGYGLGVKILLDNQPARIDPLGPDNILAFVPGLLSGTRTFFSGRYMVVGKSPLTGGWGDANSGGSLSPEIKACGCDGIFVRGCSQKPVYIHVTETTVEIKSAEHLWGLDTFETEDKLVAELGPGIKVATIGPGGENLALIAGIFNEKGRTAARSGLGAVMGAKKLKAIAIRGKKKVPVADPALLTRANKAIALPLQFNLHQVEKVIGDAAKTWVLPPLLRRRIDFKPTVKMVVSSLKEHGTGAATAISVESGDAPVRNWKGVGMVDFPWKYSSKISDKSTEPYVTKKYRCANCPLGCGALVSVNNGKYATKETHRPEYETAAVFGSNILNDNYEAIIKANDLCNRFGLDTISTGSVIAFAMECYERGIITAEDTGGIPLVWGNADSVIKLIEDIAYRQGLGELLADGVARASKILGHGSQEYAIH
ncbi:MAG TPA: aldehyde ferredoxin oxidoreductase, partial [Clostridia bacterium]|nr:aldehyde ferredoxin oxidoreductase [Clostridia bacterium]